MRCLPPHPPPPASSGCTHMVQGNQSEAHMHTCTMRCRNTHLPPRDAVCCMEVGVWRGEELRHDFQSILFSFLLPEKKLSNKNNVQQKVVSQCLASIDWVHCAQSPCIVGEGKGERVGGRELVSRRLHVAVHVSPSLSHLSIRAPLWFSERWDQG